VQQSPLALVVTDMTPRNVVALAAMAPILPLSLAAISKLNRALEDSAIEANEALVDTTLRTWGRLHRLRSACAIVGFVLLTLPI
jgi:hypothetical protein